MARPLTIVIQSICGSEVRLCLDGAVARSVEGGSEDEVCGAIEQAGTPANMQVLVHDSKILFTDYDYECLADEETTLQKLLSGLSSDVTTLTLSLVRRDPIVAEWLDNIRSYSCSSLEEAPEIVRGSDEVLLSAARRGMIEDVFKYASYHLLEDEIFMQKAVKISGDCLQYACEALQADRDIVKAAVRQDGLSLRFAAENMRADGEIVMEAVKNNGSSMEYATSTLKNNRDFVTKAVKAGGKALGFVNHALVDRDLMLAAVKSDGCAFQWAFGFHGDREIALEAVRNVGDVLEFASTELKADQEIVGTAAMSEKWAIDYADDTLKNNKAFLWACVKVNPENIQSVGKLVTEDDQLMREYAQFEKKMQCPSYLDFTSSRLRKNKEYVMDAIKFYTYAIMSASEELKQDRDLWLQCLDDGDGGCLWEECPQSLKEDWEFAVECCRVPGRQPSDFPHFSQADLEAEVSKRGGPCSRTTPWAFADAVYNYSKDRCTGPWPGF